MTARSRVATVPLVGGRPVLDLVNTVSWRGDPGRREDHLGTAEHCVTWAVRAGVLEPDEAERLGALVLSRPGRLLRGLLALRTDVAAWVDGTAGVAVLEPALADAVAHGHLVRDPTSGSHRWAVATIDEDTVRRRLGCDLLDLLTGPPARIGTCADPVCRWAFLDTSRGSTRRWCSSADCGNRARVRAHSRRRP